MRGEIRDRQEAIPPEGFQVVKEDPLGRKPILDAFPGLDTFPTAERLEPTEVLRHRLFHETQVEIVDEDLWMYVAPWKPRKSRRGGDMVHAPGQDVIVIGRDHLVSSPPLHVFLDIFHELCHVRQRRAGAELFDASVSYVRRWTEVEAYRFVVNEARRGGIADRELRDYLTVEWITPDEFAELLQAVGVSLER